LLKRFPERLQQQPMKLSVCGKERHVRVHSPQVQLRSVWPCQACAARLIIVEVPGLRMKPWYLLTTDLELDAVEAVRAYEGRYRIEVNMDEVKELGLGDYQGRSGQGVRRSPLLHEQVRDAQRRSVAHLPPAYERVECQVVHPPGEERLGILEQRACACQ
jgi:hypothetical protein